MPMFLFLPFITKTEIALIAELNKLPGVEKATVSFMTEKLTLTAADDKFEEVLEAAKALTKKLEPDWEIVEK